MLVVVVVGGGGSPRQSGAVVSQPRARSLDTAPRAIVIGERHLAAPSTAIGARRSIVSAGPVGSSGATGETKTTAYRTTSGRRQTAAASELYSGRLAGLSSAPRRPGLAGATCIGPGRRPTITTRRASERAAGEVRRDERRRAGERREWRRCTVSASCPRPPFRRLLQPSLAFSSLLRPPPPPPPPKRTPNLSPEDFQLILIPAKRRSLGAQAHSAGRQFKERSLEAAQLASSVV